MKMVQFFSMCFYQKICFDLQTEETDVLKTKKSITSFWPPKFDLAGSFVCKVLFSLKTI